MTMKTAKKTLTYSLMHLVVAVSVAYALTRNWHAALAIGLIEPIFQTAAFAVHERLWARAERKSEAGAASLGAATI
jgi:uncharacterized membrane protein